LASAREEPFFKKRERLTNQELRVDLKFANMIQTYFNEFGRRGRVSQTPPMLETVGVSPNIGCIILKVLVHIYMSVTAQP
jgi:hypothetical protein